MTTSSAAHSQAFGFMSFLQNGVDPRTGQYTASISLPELHCNELSGPVVPLGLSFNPLNTLDSGFGLGWNMNLTQFTPHNNMLSLSTGETFKLTSTMPDGTPVFKEKKLDSFHFKDNGDGSYQVQHKSGLIEELVTGGSNDDRAALPHRIYSPSGHMVSLTYDGFRGGQLLRTVSDVHGVLLQINRNASSSSVEILLHPDGDADGKPLARYELKLDTDGWLTALILPTTELASWRFQYELIRGILCIKEIKTPVGGRETVDYLDGGHLFPGTAPRPNLPRVTRHRNYPGFGQPMMEVTYRYESTDQNRGHNFIGNGASVSWADDGLDNLYKVTHTYDYGTVAELRVDNQIVRSVVRTFNRFHLLTEEKTTQNHCVKRILSTYYAIDDVFDRQVAQFQLAKKVETRWEMDNDNKGRSEEIHTVFDIHGNLLEQVDSDSIRTTYTYYPKEGAVGCPPDPQGFERNLWETTVYPAPDLPGAAPILLTRNRYIALAPLAASNLTDWLVIDNETLYQKQGNSETELQRTERRYNNLPADAVLHGRPCSQDVILNAKTTRTDYAYSKPVSLLAGEAVLQTVETLSGFDHQPGIKNVQKIITTQHSLGTGQPVLTVDLNNLQILTRYDALGRVTSETVTPGTEFEVTRTYTYFLTSLDGQQASQILTDIEGIETHTRFDGDSRVIYQGRLEPVTKFQSEPRQTYGTVYSPLGDLIEEINYDWLDDEQQKLSTFFEYDSWGLRCSVIVPGGVAFITDMSPFEKDGPIMRSWQQSDEQPPTVSALSVSKYNLFGKVNSVERFDAQSLNNRLMTPRNGDPASVTQLLDLLLGKKELSTIGSQYYSYDGRGNCIKKVDLIDNLERTSGYQYDVWGRMECTTLPDKTIVSRTFAEHHTEELPTALKVTPGNGALPTISVGRQTFDGLLRLTELAVGPRVEKYAYTDGEMQIRQRTRPDNAIINYEYNLSLTAQPTVIKASDMTATYDYDSKNAAITNAGNNQGSRQYKYDRAGHLICETWTDIDGKCRQTTYVNSLSGRPKSRINDGGLETVYDYDQNGRMERITQGALQAEFKYNRLGQLCCTSSRNLLNGSTLDTEVAYDTQGREIQRTLNLSGHPSRTIIQTWFADGQLQSRHLESAGRSLLKENFIYDLRDRLEDHKCSGEILPKDAFGNAITEQIFKFDALDNIQRCVTQFAGGNSDVATFTYATNDSCQLLSVRHTYTEGGYPALQAFEYDANGHMLNDERGRRLSYDSLGRLLEVKDSNGQQSLSTYRYDGHDHLVGVSQGNTPETLRFYQGFNLSHTIQGNQYTQYLHYEDIPIGVQQLNDDNLTMLLLTDATQKVIGESQQGELRTAVYSAYGCNDNLLQGLLAFNGEVREISGSYLLGRGYRAYNPNLMRFNSPDSMSPFGAGGINPYIYCLGNPISFQDPSGHRSSNSDARRPGNPGYIDPAEKSPEPSFLEKWLPVAGLVVGVAIGIAFTPFSGGLSIPLMIGITGIVIGSASVVVGVLGTLDGDSKKMAIAMWLGIGGTIASVGSGVVAGRLAQAAAKAAAKASVKAAVNAGGKAGVLGVFVGSTSAIAMGTVSSAGVGTIRTPMVIPRVPVNPGPVSSRRSSGTDFVSEVRRASSAPSTSTPDYSTSGSRSSSINNLPEAVNHTIDFIVPLPPPQPSFSAPFLFAQALGRKLNNGKAVFTTEGLGV